MNAVHFMIDSFVSKNPSIVFHFLFIDEILRKMKTTWMSLFGNHWDFVTLDGWMIFFWSSPSITNHQITKPTNMVHGWVGRGIELILDFVTHGIVSSSALKWQIVIWTLLPNLSRVVWVMTTTNIIRHCHISLYLTLNPNP